jgi:serine/threonine protein phosphatase PrpC
MVGYDDRVRLVLPLLTSGPTFAVDVFSIQSFRPMCTNSPEPITMNNPFELETAEFEFLISPSALDHSQPKPPSTLLRVEFGAVTHTGKVRPHNEDHFLVSQLSRKQSVLLTNVPDDQFPEFVGDDAYSMIVADGMGGMAAGEVASRMAITTGLKLFQKSPKWGFKINKREARELFDRVNGYLQEIDLELTNRSEGDRKLYGMGTTLTAAYSIGIDLFIIHLGDSRAYLFRGGELTQLTKDHTVAQAMADAGYIAPEEVRHHNKRNVLTNFLGGHGGKVKADVRWLRLKDRDRLLLCSDGLNDMVDDASIARIMGAHDQPAGAAQSLLDEALDRGGRDNVTVIVARYQIPSLVYPAQREIAAQAPDAGGTTDSLETVPPLTIASLN